MREGEASMTARRVAAHRLAFDRVPCPWATSTRGADDDQRLQADVAAGLTVEPTPMTRYLQARTTFFDTVVVRSLDPGGGHIDQAVSVGAGYDGRSLRYARPSARWFELDHPETQADKRARLDELRIATPDITFVAADFAVDDLAAALAAAGHDPERPSVFTCEGVAGYLEPGAVSSLLAALARSAGPGSRLAITLPLEPRSESERLRRERLDAAVASMGEPLASTIPQAELPDRLRAAGWDVRRATDPAGVALDQSSRSSAFVVAVPA
ncbi:MAG: class I SAM-dependent methyltransferase [Acidimicrobiales bacterium]